MKPITPGLVVCVFAAISLSVVGTEHVYREGDIELSDRQQLTIEGVTYHLAGNILLHDEAKVVIRDATLILSPVEPNLWGDAARITLHDQSQLEITDTTILVQSEGSHRPRMWINARHSSSLSMSRVVADRTKVFARPGSTFTAVSTSLLEVTISDTATTTLVDVTAQGITIEFWSGGHQELSGIRPGRDLAFELERAGNGATYLLAQGVTTDSIGVLVAGTTTLAVRNSVLDSVAFWLEDPGGEIDGLVPGHFDDWSFLQAHPVEATIDVAFLNTDITCCLTLSIDGGSRPFTVRNSDLLNFQIWDYHGLLNVHDTALVGMQVYDSTISLDLAGSTITHGLDIESSSLYVIGDCSFSGEADVHQWIESGCLRKFTIRVEASDGTPLANATGQIIGEGKTLEFRTDEDGEANVWLSFTDANVRQQLRVSVSSPRGECVEGFLSLLSTTPVVLILGSD